ERWQRRRGPVLMLSAEPETIHQAILAARPGVRSVTRPVAATEPVLRKPVDRHESGPGGVIAVAGGFGSSGRTTMGINLATALDAPPSTWLAEMELGAPPAAASLDGDPSRNVCTLAHAVRDDPHLWGPALGDELQPLGSVATQALLLCGPPKREMRASLG